MFALIGFAVVVVSEEKENGDKTRRKWVFCTRKDGDLSQLNATRELFAKHR